MESLIGWKWREACGYLSQKGYCPIELREGETVSRDELDGDYIFIVVVYNKRGVVTEVYDLGGY